MTTLIVIKPMVIVVTFLYLIMLTVTIIFFVREFGRRQMKRDKNKVIKYNSDLPRRCRLDRCTNSELAITKAMIEVEKDGCDSRLTEAIMLLEEARNKVSDVVDDRILIAMSV